MNSRERIIEALNHREADRVPIDFGGTRSTGIHAIAYNNLNKYLFGINNRVLVYDVYQQLAVVESRIRERLGGDVVELKSIGGGGGTSISTWKQFEIFHDGGDYYLPGDFEPEVLVDGSLAIVKDGRIIASMPKDGYYFDNKYFPLSGIEGREGIDVALKERITDEELDFLEAQAKELRENKDCAILGSFGGDFFEAGHSLFGYREFMERMITDETLVEYFLHKLEEKHLEDLDRYLDKVGNYLDVIVLWDDFGTQESLQISGSMFKRIFKPHMKALCDFIKSRNREIFIFLHSCGAVSRLIPEFIDAGIQILNPVQTGARGMEPEFLKREFGKDMVFWGGGCDTLKILPFGSIREIEEDVKRRIDIFGPGGGFVFAPIHNIQKETTPEKILALFETAEKFGIYGDKI